MALASRSSRTWSRVSAGPMLALHRPVPSRRSWRPRGCYDPLAHRRGSLPRRTGHVLRGGSADVDADVDPIGQRAAQLRPVPPDRGRLAVTLGAVGAVAAGTWIRRRDQEEPAGELDSVTGSRQGDASLLERLAKRLQRIARELPELVEEEDTLVGQRHLPRPGWRPATDEAGRRDGVVRGPERPG